MKTALSFWQMPADDRAFFDFLRTTGPVLARDHRTVLRSEPLGFQPLSAFRRRASGLLLLCRAVDVEAKQLDKFKAGGRLWHTVNPKRSPVLTYGREKPLWGDLPLSSIGGDWDFIHLRSGARCKKDPGFTSWGKVVIAWVRGRCTANLWLHGFAYPATPAAAAAVTAKQVGLVM